MEIDTNTLLLNAIKDGMREGVKHLMNFQLQQPLCQNPGIGIPGECRRFEMPILGGDSRLPQGQRFYFKYQRTDSFGDGQTAYP